MANDFFSSLTKGLSSFLPQDNPELKLITSQTKIGDLQKQLDEVYGKIGQAVMAGADGAARFPNEAQKIATLQHDLAEAKGELETLKAEKNKKEAEAQADKDAHTCPECGTVNPDGTKFCNECGAKLGVARECFCGECGAKNPVGTKFCGSCGARIGG